VIVNKAKIPMIFGYFVLFLFFIFVCLPFLWTISASFKPYVEMFSVPPKLLPKSPTLVHYVNVLTKSDLGLFLRNSLVVAVASVAISMCLGIPAAFGLVLVRSKLVSLVLSFIIVVRMLPPVTLVIPFFMLMRSARLIDTRIGLIIAYLPLVLPLVIWMLEGFFREVPKEIIEAAEIDGLRTGGVLLRVVLPLSLPAISNAALFGFLVAWNEFIFALTLTRTTAAQTIPVGIAGYVTAFQTFWGQMTAMATLYVIPAMLFTVFAQKGLIRGLTAGALKG